MGNPLTLVANGFANARASLRYTHFISCLCATPPTYQMAWLRMQQEGPYSSRRAATSALPSPEPVPPARLCGSGQASKARSICRRELLRAVAGCTCTNALPSAEARLPPLQRCYTRSCLPA